MLGLSTTLLNGMVHKALGVRSDALPWLENFNGSGFVGKSPSGIVLNRWEAGRADVVPKAHRLYTVA